MLVYRQSLVKQSWVRALLGYPSWVVYCYRWGEFDHKVACRTETYAKQTADLWAPPPRVMEGRCTCKYDELGRFVSVDQDCEFHSDRAMQDLFF